MLTNYFKIAFRHLVQNKVASLVNVFGLALGIMCSLAIFICIRYELTFDAFHSRADQTYRVVEHHHTSDGIQFWNSTAYPLAAAIRSDLPEVDVTQTAGPISHVVSSNEGGTVTRFDEKQVLFADPSFLQLFDFKALYSDQNPLWLAGNPKTALSNANSVVLTQRLAANYFPKATARRESVLGKTLTLNNKDVLTVTGVIRNPPANTSLLFDLLIPYQFYKQNNPYFANNWAGNYQGTTYVSLPKNVNAAALERKLVAFKKKYLSPEDDKRIDYFLQPLRQMHTETRYGNSINSYVVGKSTLWILASLGAFLLLIACINFINLSTAKAVKRVKEVGVRKVVGSTRGQLVAQFLTETLLIVFMAVVLSWSVLDFLLTYLNESLSFISLHLTTDPTILGIGLLLLLLITLLAGFYPAFILSGYKPISMLSRLTVPTSRKSILRQSLIIVQFAIAQLLIVGTIIIADQMKFIRTKDLGFTKDAVVVVNVPDQQKVSLSTFRSRLLQNPAIKQVSYASGTPTTVSNHFGTNFRLAWEPVSMMRSAEMKVVDTAYLNLYNLKLVAGQWLTQSNVLAEGFNGLVVNEALVAMLGLKPHEAIGKQVVINEGKAPIIGVIHNFHNNSLQESVSPCLLLNYGNGFFSEASIQLASSHGQPINLAQSLSSIEKAWKETFPEGIYRREFLNDSLAKSYFVEDLAFKAVGLFSGIAILIACLGLFGLAAFTAEQRTKEIGLRKVLGASVASIVALLSTDFLKLVLIAIVAATPIAWYVMNQWLQDFAYKIDIEWWIFAVAGLLAIGIALLTVSFQSIKAALMNPVKSLKTE